MAKKDVVTIGYGNSKLNDFLSYLTKYKVNHIVDVRSFPNTSHLGCYNSNELIRFLERNGISYEWLGDYLGGRPDSQELYVNNVVSYEKLVETKKFKEGIENLEKVIETKNVCIMCSEWNPMDCHRFMAISKVLSQKGYNIWHILSSGKYVKNEILERELIELYYGQGHQISMEEYDNGKLDIKEESYKKHNIKKGSKFKK